MPPAPPSLPPPERTLLLVDAPIYVFRAWCALPGSLQDPEGHPNNAVRGFARFLADLLARPVAHLACCFDESLTTSFRNEIDPSYKANRPEAPEDLMHQFAACRRLCRVMGVPELADARFEADDLIGALAARGRAAGLSVVIASRDKDLTQLLHDGDRLWDPAGDRIRGPEELLGELGVRPDQVADWLALTGDAVDNIRGVPGIGAKTAALLLQRFGTLEALLSDPDAVAVSGLRGAARLAQRLREHAEDARLARRLTGIGDDAPLPEPAPWLPTRGPARAEALASFGLGRDLHARLEKAALP